MNAGLESVVNTMTPDQRAALAAEVLNMVEPSEGLLGTFFSALNDEVHDEVVARAAEEPDRG